MNTKKDIIEFYCQCLESVHWKLSKIVIKEMIKELNQLRIKEAAK